MRLSLRENRKTVGRRKLPYEETASRSSMKLLSTTCFPALCMHEDRVGPAPIELPCESKRKPCSILKYAAMFSSRALTPGVSPV